MSKSSTLSTTAQTPLAAEVQIRGAADQYGQPIPYGYAMTGQEVIPTRRKESFKVPMWMGLAGFLTGVSFLLSQTPEGKVSGRS